MLWLGDNVYLREVDWWSEEGIAYRYGHNRAEPALQPLLAAVPHYATWDDHDYGPNNSDRSYVLKGAALETFTRYWPAAARGLPGVPGVFTQFQWGDVEFFLLDDRYHRAPERRAGPGADGPRPRAAPVGRGRAHGEPGAVQGRRDRRPAPQPGPRVRDVRGGRAGRADVPAGPDPGGAGSTASSSSRATATTPS